MTDAKAERLLRELAFCEHGRTMTVKQVTYCMKCGAQRYPIGTQEHQLRGDGWHLPELVAEAKKLLETP